MKKAQAALEFLTTYGWAFLVIIVMIAALVGFGILDPAKFTSERCIFGVPLNNCPNFKLEPKEATFQLQNGLHEDITIPPAARSGLQYKNKAGTWTSCTEWGLTTIPSGSIGTLRCVLEEADFFTPGKRGNLEIKLRYYTGSSDTYTKEVFGKISSNVLTS